MNHSGRPSSVTLWHLPAAVALTIVILSVVNFFPRFGRITYRQNDIPSGCQKILWFTGFVASSASTPYDASDLLKVALLSAKKRAPSLVPVLIYSGPREHPLPSGVPPQLCMHGTVGNVLVGLSRRLVTGWCRDLLCRPGLPPHQASGSGR